MEIWLPTRTEEPAYICNVPVNDEGEGCGQLFYKGQERLYRTHVARCAKEHQEFIISTSIRQR